jgi:HEAT repeat protein
MTIRLGVGCLILLGAATAPAEEQRWSERFPAIAQRIPHLDLRLTAQDAAIRKRVLTDLTYIRPRDSTIYPPFLRALLKDPSSEVRGEAVKRLWEHHVFLGPEELPDSIDVPLVGGFRWRDPAELDRLRDLAGQRDAPSGGWAIYALGLAGDAKAIPLARALLESKNVFVRHSAAVALVQLRQTKDGIEALRRITDAEDDESGYYRYRAAEDLARLGERQAIDVLIDLIESYSDCSSGPREIVEDLTGQYFLTAAEARAWRQKNSGSPPHPASAR